MKTETCKALDLLERAEILDVNGYLIHNWNLEVLDENNQDESVFDFSYTDEEGYIFTFSFVAKNLLEASVVGHTISMMDDTGEMVDVACYVLSALEPKN